MSVYEPADKILEEAKNKAAAIMRQTKQMIISIQTTNQKIVNEKIDNARTSLLKELETSALAEYSKTKITYDKSLQNELAKKRIEVKSAIIYKLVKDPRYAKILNQNIKEIVKGAKAFNVYANFDKGLIAAPFTAAIDKSLAYGFKIDLGDRVYDFDTGLIVEDYLKNHPIEV